MAVQELTQPILNPIAAFDATVEHTISFVAIGGAQVLGNRLVISNNQTGAVVYNQMQTTMRLEHVIPANTLQNGGYYNAVVYTVSSGGEESVASTAVPFYCYSRPTLTINNILATETIENGTYTFTASYSQAENELLDSYQFTLYDSNRNILSQSNLIYYQTDSSLSYTFVGMSNDTAYYIGITGETVNGTQITSGLVYFTVRYSQPASFAICDLVNDCENGYIQISSNIVAIDGKSNPDPPIYIDDKEVDLREPGSWVEWDEGFDIQNDFTMRVWGRDFNEYENIITLKNDENTDSNPNRIELKWMVGDVLKNLPEYSSVNGYNINIENAEATTIENLRIAGNSIQQTNSGEQIVAGNGFVNFNTVAEKPINIEIEGTQEQETISGIQILQNTNQGATGYTFSTNPSGLGTIQARELAGGNGAIFSLTQDLTSWKYITRNANISQLKNNTTYTIQFDCKTNYNESQLLVRIQYGDTSQNFLSFPRATVNNERKRIKLVATSNDTALTGQLLYIQPNALNTVGEEFTISNLILVEGDYSNTELEWEDYTNLEGSPSPNYPSEVVCLGSNKNIFDGTNKNYYINQQANSCGVAGGNSGSIIDVKGKSNVTISSSIVQTRFRAGCVNSEVTDAYAHTIYNGVNKDNRTEMTINCEGYNYLIINATDLSKIKVEKGTEATSYSPPGQGSTKIKKDNGLHNIQVEQGSLNSSTGTIINADTRLRTADFVEIKNFNKIDCKGMTTCNVFFYDTNKTYLGRASTSWETLPFQFEILQNAVYLKAIFRKDDEVVTPDMIKNLRLYSEETDYLLYIQQEMLNGDYFVKEADGWKEVHIWNKLIFTGQENWDKSGASTDEIFVATLDIENGVDGYGYSNYFRYYGHVEIGCFSVYNNGANIRFCVDSSVISDINRFKTMLADKYNAGNPAYAFYKTTTTTKLSCTEEQNTILNELSNNMSFVGENNIYTSGDLPIPIKVSDIATPTPSNPSDIYSVGEVRNLIDVADFNIAYNQQYFQATNTNFVLKSNFIYTLSFNYEVNSTTTDLYYTLGYGTDSYVGDITGTNQYTSLTSGRNSITFVVPDDMPANSILWVKFGQTIILADIDVNISNIQLEEGSILHNYEEPELYNIYPTISAKNIYNENSILYLKKENITYSVIQNGYNIVPATVGEEAYFGIGWRNILNAGDTYAIGYSSLGNLTGFNLYMVDKNGQGVIDEIEVNNGVFTAPEGVYDLQLTFGIDSSVSTNYVEIWNIQIEANNTISQFETYTSNGSIISTDTPLRGIDNYRDLIALESPNLLNQATQSGNVIGGETYYLNQSGDTTYYIWYYNIAGNLITFLDPEGQETSGVSGIRGSFTVHDECVRITMTKSANPEANDLTSDEILSNEVSITRGSTAQLYYPYVTQPSKIVNIGVINNLNSTSGTWYLNTNYQNSCMFQLNGDFDFKVVSNTNDIYVISNQFLGNSFNNVINDNGYGYICLGTNEGRLLINILNSITGIESGDNNSTRLNKFKTWIDQQNQTNPINVYYVKSNPAIYPLPKESITGLSELSTYNPISNVYTNNQVLGNISLDYVTGYSEQQTQNAYVQLKCYNSNNMPYFVHSNYIDIPEDISTVFIWCRRRNNLFDLQIEDLGDYDGEEQPEDTNPPVVTLDIDLEEVTSSTIPVTAQSIDDVGLRTVRFSKDNGQTWDEVVPVDGLSSTNSYTFTGLSANTLYTIRVEAIDLSGNIGGMSQQVTTHVS